MTQDAKVSVYALITHSISAKSACSECAIEDSETATILESRLIMNEGIDTHSRIRNRCRPSAGDTCSVVMSGSRRGARNELEVYAPISICGDMPALVKTYLITGPLASGLNRAQRPRRRGYERHTNT